jgi:hypothetical protein
MDFLQTNTEYAPKNVELMKFIIVLVNLVLACKALEELMEYVRFVLLDQHQQLTVHLAQTAMLTKS